MPFCLFSRRCRNTIGHGGVCHTCLGHGMCCAYCCACVGCVLGTVYNADSECDRSVIFWVLNSGNSSGLLPTSGRVVVLRGVAGSGSLLVKPYRSAGNMQNMHFDYVDTATCTTACSACSCTPIMGNKLSHNMLVCLLGSHFLQIILFEVKRYTKLRLPTLRLDWLKYKHAGGGP